MIKPDLETARRWLAQSNELRSVRSSYKPGKSLSVKLDDCGLAATIAAWREGNDSFTVVITPGIKSAWRLVNQLGLWLGNEAARLLPAVPINHFSASAFASNDANLRLGALRTLVHATRGVVVVPAEAALAKTVSPAEFARQTRVVKVGQQVAPDKLISDLVDCGYEVVQQVELPATVCKRGGIVDLFVPGASSPARIEFWGDTVEQIRLFNPASQLSQKQLRDLTVTAATEYPRRSARSKYDAQMAKFDWSNCRDLYAQWEGGSDGATHQMPPLFGAVTREASFADYLQPATTVVLVRPNEIASTAAATLQRELDTLKEFVRRERVPHGFPPLLNDWDAVLQNLRRCHILEFAPWGVEQDGVRAFNFKRLPLTETDIEEVATTVKTKISDGWKVAVVSVHAARIESVLKSPDAELVNGQLGEGFEFVSENGAKYCVLTDRELFGVSKEPVYRRSKIWRPSVQPGALKKGDYVVHIDHGIARFGGIRTFESSELEHLILEYAEGDRVYVPVTQVDRVHLYKGTARTVPRLSNVRSGGWKRAKEQTRLATELLAGELFARDVRRQAFENSTCSTDSPWQLQMEAAFPFTETPDQLTSIDSVKKDLELKKPMDRLVCGDVGYGKTEVALRAAFKVAANGAQVAVIAPTTLLASQHYETFRERVRPFPVEIGLLSGFVPKPRQKKVLDAITKGTLDIVVGTHRLLQHDIAFKNLQLAIVDEEHRFGVRHKEMLKQISSGVNLLTLSATPIPRTLHMALSGVRDISIINTPPEHRQPVTTYVTGYSDEVMREALLSELNRDGQAFVVHNRVKTIHSFAKHVAELVPAARVVVAHAQMGAPELEQTMKEFTEHEHDILVTTSIVESGLDLHNVNTLIVDRADRFGLAQLYQLRGRVGRGHNIGYAYLFIPHDIRLSEEADQRMRAILDASELGSGLRLARDDLQIRGGGTILGDEQSGHMSAIGAELYTQMLAKAVKEARLSKSATPPPPPLPPLKVSLPVETFFPVSYIASLPQRLVIYRRLAELTEPYGVEEIESELRDRFGKPPVEAKRVLITSAIRIKAQKLGVISVLGGEDEVTVTFKQPIRALRSPLAKNYRAGLEFGYKKLTLEIDPEQPLWIADIELLLDRLTAVSSEL